MTTQQLREHINFYLHESLQPIVEVDYDNLVFLPENDVDFSNQETINKCSTFNVQDLKKQRSWAAKVRYLDNCLPRLGVGSARVVYLLEPTKVIKLAKNDKGIAQNEIEAGLMRETDGGYYSILAKIIDYDEDYLWVEMEVAKKINAKSFRDATGMSWKDFQKYIMYADWDQRNLGNYYDKIPTEIKENDFFTEILDFASNNQMILGDLK